MTTGLKMRNTSGINVMMLAYLHQQKCLPSTNVIVHRGKKGIELGPLKGEFLCNLQACPAILFP